MFTNIGRHFEWAAKKMQNVPLSCHRISPQYTPLVAELHAKMESTLVKALLLRQADRFEPYFQHFVCHYSFFVPTASHSFARRG